MNAFRLCIRPFALIVLLAGASASAGDQIIIRRYNQLDQNPAAYEGIATKLQSGGVILVPERLVDDGVFVFTAADQKDSQTAAELGACVYSVKYHAGRIEGGALTIPVLRRDLRFRSECLELQDAFGRPLASATVEARLGNDGPIFGKFRLDEEGIVDLPFPRGAYTYYTLTISHPKYTTAVARTDKMLRFPSGFKPPVRDKDGNWTKPRNPYAARLACVAADDPELERCLLGRVLMPDGSPAAGAHVNLTNVIIPEQGRLGGMSWTLVAGPDGRFRAYAPMNTAPRGTLVPKGAEYEFTVELPNDPSHPRKFFHEPGGKEVDVKLVSGNKPRSFVFEDENGPITDPERLRHFKVIGAGLELDWPEFAQDRSLLPGRYTAYSPDATQFDPVVIDASSPELVVFRQKQRVSYEGRVIDAGTSRPMAGVLVMAVGNPLSSRMESISAAQWDLIHKLPPKPDVNDPALAAMRSLYNVKDAVRTDADGRFAFQPNPGGAICGIAAAAENFLGAFRTVGQPAPIIRHKIVLDDFKLLPAATVSVTIPNQSADPIRFAPAYQCDGTKYPYANDLVFHKNRSTEKIHVPAGAAFEMVLRPGLLDIKSESRRPIRIHVPSLAQGEVYDAGTFELKPAAIVAVRVVDPNDEPLALVTVYCRGSEQGTITYFGLPHTTDEAGLAHFFVEPGTQGEFALAEFRGGLPVFNVRIPYACAPEATELPLHTMRLTAEQAASARTNRMPCPKPASQNNTTTHSQTPNPGVSAK